MIRVNKIAHATYETPDLDKQTEYYTDIMGLTLVSKEKDTPTSPPRSIIIPSFAARRARQTA